MPKLPSDWSLNYHATAYNVWNNGQKPGDETITLDRNMCVDEGRFNTPFFTPLSASFRNINITEENWSPVGMIILAHKSNMGRHGSYHPEIPQGNKLKLVGRTFSKTVGSGDFKRYAPVYVYALEKSLEESNN